LKEPRGNPRRVGKRKKRAPWEEKTHKQGFEVAYVETADRGWKNYDRRHQKQWGHSSDMSRSRPSSKREMWEAKREEVVNLAADRRRGTRTSGGNVSGKRKKEMAAKQVLRFKLLFTEYVKLGAAGLGRESGGRKGTRKFMT